VSSAQHRDVFSRCTGLAKELEQQGRLEDSVAVLRALSVYLDAFPAMPDASCQSMTRKSLDLAGSALRARGLGNAVR
jgi:hypothetical protein